MGAPEVDESGTNDIEEIIDEGNGDTEGTELSEISGLNGQEGEASTPLPEETNLTSETPIGLEEDRVLRSQENAAAESKIEEKYKQNKEEILEKLSEQLTRQFQLRKVEGAKTHDLLRQIQKQLRQIDKIAAGGTKQQIMIKQMTVQVRIIQKQLDKVTQAVNRFKSTPTAKGKNNVKSKSRRIKK